MKTYRVLLQEVATCFHVQLGEVEASSCEEAILKLGGEPEWVIPLWHNDGKLVGSELARDLAAQGYILVVQELPLAWSLLVSPADLLREVRQALARRRLPDARRSS